MATPAHVSVTPKTVRVLAQEHFPDCTVLKYALEVEKITTRKKSNLILNVDGTIGCAFVDLLRGSGAFTREEADDYIKAGVLNGLFVLGRSVGFIGHYLDQKRLKQSLYRHPWDDICYMCAETPRPAPRGHRDDRDGAPCHPQAPVQHHRERGRARLQTPYQLGPDQVGTCRALKENPRFLDSLHVSGNWGREGEARWAARQPHAARHGCGTPLGTTYGSLHWVATRRR